MVSYKVIKLKKSTNDTRETIQKFSICKNLAIDGDRKIKIKERIIARQKTKLDKERYIEYVSESDFAEETNLIMETLADVGTTLIK